MSDISNALKAFFETGKGSKTMEKFITEKNSSVETFVAQFSRASDAKNNLTKKFKANSKRCPSMKFDFETLWSSAQVKRAVILERNEVSVKLVRLRRRFLLIGKLLMRNLKADP
ncbi:hypothetical protein EDC94DRAFT_589510 [Helicostylum pulchrum]|nr:hypothetical protein EDC94DRAFT_589510 [Helicostylum pulchrum]